MTTAKENTRNGAIIGSFIGLLVSAFSNGWITVSADLIAGQSIAQVYVFIIPAISTLVTFGSIFTKKIKPSTKMGGGLAGFSCVTLLIGFLFYIVPTILSDIFDYLVK